MTTRKHRKGRVRAIPPKPTPGFRQTDEKQAEKLPPRRLRAGHGYLIDMSVQDPPTPR